jgi:hypothetical protein
MPDNASSRIRGSPQIRRPARDGRSQPAQGLPNPSDHQIHREREIG